MPAPQRIDPQRWFAYFDARARGQSKTGAAAEAGISLRTITLFDTSPLTSSGSVAYRAWLARTPVPDARSYKELPVEPRRALGDFEYFRKRYFGHISMPWHVEAANKMQELLARPEKSYAVVNCPPGCLTGDTIVTVNRGGNSRRMRLDHVESMFNGGTRSGRTWDPAIPTRISRAEDGYERLGEVRAVYRSGLKAVFALTTATGKTIRASAEHPFLRPDGDYTDLADLRVGDEVMVLGGRGTGVSERKRYSSAQTAFHPHQRKAKDGYRYWTHRLTMEAHLNGLSYPDYLYALRAQPMRCKEFVFLSREDVVHHLDSDHSNNALSNLALTTHAGHRALHAAANATNVLRQIIPDRIVAITPAGVEETFDITMADEPHNFLAAGLVVHNSGKSTLFSNDYPLWALMNNRNLRVLIGTWAESTGSDYLLRIRRNLERTMPVEADEIDFAAGRATHAVATLSHDFGRFKPDGSAYWSADKLVLARAGGAPAHQKEASVAVYGRKSGFLGGRYNLVIWDDVVTDTNSRTPEQQEEMARWWRNTAESRLEPGGLLILQGQRLGPNDLYRYALNLRDIGAGFDLDNSIDDEDFDEEDLPAKYHHIVYRAHYETVCKGGDHKHPDHKIGAKPWPAGCLLDPQRLTYRDLRMAQYNDPKNYATVYQQEDTDPDSVLVNPLWINGGENPLSKELHPGCLDRERQMGQWPQGLAGDLYSVITADPSPSQFWGCILSQYQVQTGFTHVIDIARKKMGAEAFLDYNQATGTYSGLLENWWQDSRNANHPVSHVIVESNAAQKFLLQYDHAKRWAMTRGVQLVGHHTGGHNKSDPKLGVGSLAPEFRHGRVRLPAHQLTRPQLMPFIYELTHYPDAATTDLVMAMWFLLWNRSNLFAPRLAEPYSFARPTWMKDRHRGLRAV